MHRKKYLANAQKKHRDHRNESGFKKICTYVSNDTKIKIKALKNSEGFDNEGQAIDFIFTSVSSNGA